MTMASGRQQLEVIVDDGSTDGTSAELDRLTGVYRGDHPRGRRHRPRLRPDQGRYTYDKAGFECAVDIHDGGRRQTAG
ncbi:hypothetical protein [Streptomyces sp. NPDC127595]|uniref:hypothetical protein n=1 Tax=Streptomyces sp. NPDC127595 TaxID=3345405 RepID=UPI00363CD17A